MKHFDLEEWIDFVRGLAPSGQKARILAHLASGCGMCNRIASRYRSLLDIAAMQTEVPEAVVNRGKQVFSVLAWQHVRTSAPRFGWLLFDSARQPAMAGTRGLRPANRQLLFRIGKYCLDVREQRDPGTAKAMLTGQIADGDQPHRPLPGLPALLLSGGAVLARAHTNEFGEFHLEYRPRKSLTLMVVVEGETATVEIGPPSAGLAPAPASGSCATNPTKEQDSK